MGFFKASVGALFIAVAVATPVGASAAVATTPKATTLGVSARPAVSDGRSAIAIGTGADVKIFRDGHTAPVSSPTAAGCGISLAAAGTGLVQCAIVGPAGTVPTFRLVSMSTGADRPLPGASVLTSPSTSPTTFAMGSRWIAATKCAEQCQTLAIQWHTGASKRFTYDKRREPQTALDSPTLKPSASQPSVNVEGGRLVYRRGAFSRSLKPPFPQITSVHVVGWRVAWLSQGPAQGGGKGLEVNVLNAETGKRARIALSRFGASSGGGAADSRHPMSLQVTAKRVVLSFPAAADPDGYTVTSLPWPV